MKKKQLPRNLNFPVILSIIGANFTPNRGTFNGITMVKCHPSNVKTNTLGHTQFSKHIRNFSKTHFKFHKHILSLNR